MRDDRNYPCLWFHMGLGVETRVRVVVRPVAGVGEWAMRTLKRHQQRAIATAVKLSRGKRWFVRVGLFMAPGTGKTITAIRLAKRLSKPRLVLCRRDDYLTWKNELAAEGVDPDRILYVESGDQAPDPYGDTPQCDNCGLVVSACDCGCWSPGPFYHWVIVSYDLVKKPLVARTIKTTDWSIVIADECHYLKHWRSKRTKAVYRATRHVPNRIGMTGTPITNKAKDVFAQALFIDDGATFGDNEFWFLKKYYVKSGPGWYPKRGVKDMIAEKLKSLAFHVHEDDVLKLPPVMPITKGAPMSGMQRRHYTRLLEEWEYEVEQGHITEIDQVIVQMMKLRQVAGGFIYDEDRTARLFKCPKLDLMMASLKDTDAFGDKPKVIIWCSHTAEIDRVCATTCDEFVRYAGDMPQRAKIDSRERFRDDPDVRLFVAQVDAGVGMNELIVADTAFYYSNSLKVVSRQQSMRRNRRIGSEIHKSITYVDFVTEGTIDEALCGSVRKNMDFAQSVLDRIKRGEKPIDTLATPAAV